MWYRNWSPRHVYDNIGVSTFGIYQDTSVLHLHYKFTISTIFPCQFEIKRDVASYSISLT